MNIVEWKVFDPNILMGGGRFYGHYKANWTDWLSQSILQFTVCSTFAKFWLSNSLTFYNHFRDC